MKTLRALLLSLAVAIAALPAAETSDPVGAFRIRLRGNSDTFVSLPLQRPALIEATLASSSGTGLTLGADIPTLPSEGAFALVMTGSLEGAVLPILSVSGRSLTVTGDGLDLSGLKTVTVHGSTAADTIAIVPFWTLDTLFPNGTGLHVSTSASSRASEVMFFNDSNPGTNFSVAATHFYFAGNASNPAGWYRVGTATRTGSQRIAPHTFFVIRHNLATETNLLLTGGVQMSGFRIPLRLRAANTDQDNFIALPIVTPITLRASRLVESGAFKISTSASSRADELMVFDNTVAAQNKSVAATYFYFAGNASNSAGWYRVGTATSANDVTLKPGEGYIIRKRQETAPVVKSWNAVPAYLQ